MGRCLAICAPTAPEYWPPCRRVIEQRVAEGMTCTSGHPSSCRTLLPAGALRATATSFQTQPGGAVDIELLLPPHTSVSTTWQGDFDAGHKSFTCTVVSVVASSAVCETQQALAIRPAFVVLRSPTSTPAPPPSAPNPVLTHVIAIEATASGSVVTVGVAVNGTSARIATQLAPSVVRANRYVLLHP